MPSVTVPRASIALFKKFQAERNLLSAITYRLDSLLVIGLRALPSGDGARSTVLRVVVVASLTYGSLPNGIFTPPASGALSVWNALSSSLNCSIPRRVVRSGRPAFSRIRLCERLPGLRKSSINCDSAACPPTRRAKYLSALCIPGVVVSPGLAMSYSVVNKSRPVCFKASCFVFSPGVFAAG